MAKSKIPAIKDLHGHFFLGINKTNIEVVYSDSTNNGLAIGAAFVSVLEDSEELFKILSSAFLTVLEKREKKSNWEKVKISPKEKSISKTVKKPVKTPVKAAKKK